MKNLLYISFLYCILFLNVQAQDTINERYSFGYNYVAFSNVIATDSCYYIKSLLSNGAQQFYFKDGFIRFNLNGSVNFVNVYDEDTIGLNSVESFNFTKTLDNNFIQLIRTVSPSMESFMLIKQTPNGDTLFTTLLDTINKIESSIEPFRGIWPGGVIQLQDSSFLCSANVENLNWQNSFQKVVPMLIKLDKNGNYLWHKIYWDFVNPYYNLSRTYSLIQYNDSTFVITDYISHFGNDPSQSQNIQHPKWLFIDSLGNITNTLIINDLPENRSTGCFGVIKTQDNGFIYVGRMSYAYYPSNAYNHIHTQITKLNPDLTQEWRIHIDSTIFKVLTDLIPINDTEFVAVGYGTKYDNTNTCGYLVKFNINGELLWEREYVKVPLEWVGVAPQHQLFDVDQTADSGFVMVGEVVNWNPNMPNHPLGELGWLVKTDKYGCLVPGCQMYDNIGAIPIDTTTFVINPNTPDTTQTDTSLPQPPPNLLYPNPATTELYYYHVKDASVCYIFDLQGQVVQQFTVSGNNVTYIIDISQLSSATYIFKVVSNNGEVIINQKFVKVE